MLKQIFLKIDENAELQETEGSVNNEEPVEETTTDKTTDTTG